MTPWAVASLDSKKRGFRRELVNNRGEPVDCSAETRQVRPGSNGAGLAETDGLLEHVVDATYANSQGAHEGFPEEPDPDAPGQFVEFPAEFFFDPVGVHVEPDGLIQFTLGDGHYTVTASHEKFDEPEFDVPTRVPEAFRGSPRHR